MKAGAWRSRFDGAVWTEPGLKGMVRGVRFVDQFHGSQFSCFVLGGGGGDWRFLAELFPSCGLFVTETRTRRMPSRAVVGVLSGVSL